MKKLLLSLFMLLPFLAEADNQFVLKGTITGMPDSCRITLVNEDGDIERDSVPTYADICATEQFTIKATLEGPTMLRFSIMKDNPQFGFAMPVAVFSFMADNEAVELPAVSFAQLEEMSKKGNADEAVVLKAGKAEAGYKEYLALVSGDKAAISKVYEEGNDKLMLSAYGMISEDDDSVKLFKGRLDVLEKAMEAKKQDFINQHPDYAISALFVSRQVKSEYQFTTEEIDAMVAKMSSNPDKHRLAVIEGNMARAKKYALGTQLGDEAVTMADGEVKTLQQFVNKSGYTLFDCWASWCGPCRRAIPKVKAMSEDFASQLKVYSISCDQKEKDWRQAMQEEKMPWPQAIVAKEQMMPFMTAYSITTIPRLILVKDNKIVVSTNDPSAVRAYIQEHK